MPTELPGFLQDFIKHRQHIVKNAPTPNELKKKALAVGSAHKNADLDTSTASIIEKKPGRKIVDEYLQKRCDELSATKIK